MASNEAKQEVYSATQARQGEIILRNKASRIIFIAGLLGGAILLLLMWLRVL